MSVAAAVAFAGAVVVGVDQWCEQGGEQCQGGWAHLYIVDPCFEIVEEVGGALGGLVAVLDFTSSSTIWAVCCPYASGCSWRVAITPAIVVGVVVVDAVEVGGAAVAVVLSGAAVLGEACVVGARRGRYP